MGKFKSIFLKYTDCEKPKKKLYRHNAPWRAITSSTPYLDAKGVNVAARSRLGSMACHDGAKARFLEHWHAIISPYQTELVPIPNWSYSLSSVGPI